MALNFNQTDTVAPLGVIQACSPVAPTGDADAVEATVGGTAGVTGRAVSIPAATKVTGFATELQIADGDTLDGGTVVHRLNVSTAQNNLTLEDIYVCRVNSSGVSQEELGKAINLAVDISAGGVFTTNITTTAASAHNAGDRVYITVAVSNSHSMASRTLEILPNQTIDTPFTASGLDLVRILDEDVNFSEAFLAVLGLNRLIAEVENFNETLVRSSILGRIINETLNIQEVLVDHLVQVLETIIVILGLNRPISDTVNTSEVLARSLGLNRILSEVVNVVETIVRSLSFIRIQSESLNFNETLNRILGLVRLRSDVVNFNEGTISTKTISQVISESVNLVESIVEIVAADGLSLVRIINDTLNISEVINRSHILVRLSSETVNVDELIVSLKSYVRIIGEAVNISEGSVSSIAAELVKVINETLNTTENVLRLIAAGVPKDIVLVINEGLNITKKGFARLHVITGWIRE